MICIKINFQSDVSFLTNATFCYATPKILLNKFTRGATCYHRLVHALKYYYYLQFIGFLLFYSAILEYLVAIIICLILLSGLKTWFRQG